MRISQTIRLLSALAACLTIGASLFSSSVNGDGGKKSAMDDAGARAAFLEAYKVFMRPRCLNCHPAGDRPLTIIPALANALFAAMGNRYRSLPLGRHGLKLA